MKATRACIMIFVCAGISAEGKVGRAQDKGIAAPAVQRDYPQKYYHSFKGDSARPPKMQLAGPEAQECVHFEAEGLRITLPAGQPSQTEGTGLTTRFAVRGDFEITTSFEVLAAPKVVDSGSQTKCTLRVVLNRPGSNMVTFHRRVTPAKGDHFFIWRTQVNEVTGKNEQKQEIVPTSAKSGQLRLVRTGSRITGYVAEGASGAFTIVKEFPFGTEDLKEVALVASTGGPKAALDVRFTELLIRAEALPDVAASVGPILLAKKGGVAGALLIGLVITIFVGLGIWFLVKKRRQKEEASAPKELDEA